jgi:hypothetical protein
MEKCMVFVQTVLMVGFREPINICDIPHGYDAPDFVGAGVSLVSAPSEC